jgi:hypothetical protein
MMASSTVSLPCPECEAPVEFEEQTEHVVCIYCDSFLCAAEDQDENLVLQIESEPASPEQRQAIVSNLQSRLAAWQNALDEKRGRLSKVALEMKEQEDREVSLLPNPARRNGNIVIISTMVLLGVLAANLLGSGGQITGLSIFTVVVFAAIMVWMVFTYFSSKRDDHIRSIRIRYKQEFEQITDESSHAIEVLEQAIDLSKQHLAQLQPDDR